MILPLILLLLGLEIESAELLTGGAFRPGHWAPLKVRVRSASVIRGEVVVRTDVGFAVVATVEVGPDRPDPVLAVLALGIDAPLEVTFRVDGREQARYRRRNLGRGLYQSHPLVVDAAGFPLDWLEGANAVTGRAPPGYCAMGGRVVSDPSEVREKFETRWFEPVDPALCGLAPRDRWTHSKREFALWFVVLYLLAGGAALPVVSRRGIRWVGIVAIGFGCAGSLVALVAFPRGSLTVTRRSCDIGEARLDVYFLRSAKSGTFDVEFPILVKPVWDSCAAAMQDRFELQVGGGRSRVVGLRLEAGESRTFTAVTGESRPRDVEAVWKGADDSDDPTYRYFRQKLMGDAGFLYGWTGSRTVRGSTVRSADLAEERHLPTLVFRRVR